jgi:rRNA maturation endonuclease Nob1
MKCPHCGETFPSLVCSRCGEETPEKSLFCCWCGNPIKREEKETDLSDRVLCSDGNCIGTINEKGVCNECGKPNAGKLA